MSCTTILFPVLRRCYYLIGTHVAISMSWWKPYLQLEWQEGTCLLNSSPAPWEQLGRPWWFWGHPLEGPHPGSFVGHRPPAPPQRKKTKQVCLSSAQTQPAASHAARYAISGGRGKHYHIVLWAPLCLPVLPTPHKHFPELMALGESGLSVLLSWGGINHCWWDLYLCTWHTVLPELRNHLVGGGCHQHQLMKYLSRTFRSMIFLHFNQLNQRALSTSLYRRQLCMHRGWARPHRRTCDVLQYQIPKLP